MSFLAELSLADLQRLRAIVKKVKMAYHPEHLCTNQEADRIIESLGPEIAERYIKHAVDRKLIG